MPKTAVVTGASQGIGRSIAEEFMNLKYNVVIISKNGNKLKKTSEELKHKIKGNCKAFACDITKKEQVKKTFSKINEKFGGIDVLVNNAGINARSSLNPDKKIQWFENFKKMYSGWQKEIKTNLTGTYICSYLAAGYMLKKGQGTIINISSIKGKEATSSPGYGASKAGIIHLTKDFAKSLSPYGIRVNCVAPGFINTGMTTELPSKKQKNYMSQIPAKRFGETSEIAKAVSFLASESSDYITGATIDVNGGYLMS